MKKVVSILFASLLILGMTACNASPTPATSSAAPAASSNASSENPIKIGLTTVLTGDRALEGEFSKKGADIIEKEINDAGGVLGRPIQIVIEDALGTDVGAVNAYRKLADDPDIVAIIGPDSSNDNMAQSGAAMESKILTTAQGSSPKLRDLCENENEWMFQLRACDQTLCAALMTYAVDEVEIKSVAIINDTDTAGSDQARLFKEGLAKYGIVPAVELSFVTGTKDFTSHLVQIQQANVDAIVAASYQSEAAIILQQARSMGLDVPVFGSNAYADPITINLAGEAMDNTYSAAAWVPNTTTPKGIALVKTYSELYPEDCGKQAAQVYDHVSIICEAITRAGSTDRTAVRDAMYTIDSYEGAVTRYDCSTRGDCGRGGLLVKIENGASVVLQEIISEKSAN